MSATVVRSLFTLHNLRRLGLWAVALVITLIALWLLIPPPPDVWDELELSRVIRDRDGGILLFARTSDDQFRARVRLEDVPPHVIAAALRYEDRHYFLHPGVNPISLLRSTLRYLRTGQKRFGASTIAMQAARLRWNLQTTSLSGKMLQICRALQLVRHYGHKQTLELYFTLAPYGRNFQGLTAAAYFYLDKHVRDLTPREAVALAVIPQNPAVRTPRAGVDNPQLAAATARLTRMMTSLFPKTGANDALLHNQQPLVLRSPRLPHAPHFALWVLSREKQQTDVRTPLDSALQHTTGAALTSWLRDNHRLGVTNAAAVLLHRDGSVLAYHGSANFWDATILGQNDMLRAPRSPGSTLKPFIYALALQAGQIHPRSLLIDAPNRYAEFAPENDDRSFIGPLDAATALVRSRNLPAVRLASGLRDPTLYEFLIANGVPLKSPPEHYGLALALGGVEVTPLQLARLYLMLANNGQPRLLRHRLKDSDTPEPLPQTADEQSRFQGLMPEAAWLTKEMMRTVGQRVHRFPKPVAWKTGTSPKYRDAWCAGITGDIVIVVWCGHSDGRPGPNLRSARTAFPLMFRLLEAARRVRPEFFHEDDPEPPGGLLARVKVCSVSGLAPSRYTPSTHQTTIIRGVTHLPVSDVHRPIHIDIATGRRVAFPDPAGGTIEKIAEFWPPEFWESFRLSGRPRPAPPPIGAELQDASELTTRSSDAPPQITTPTPGELVVDKYTSGRVLLRVREMPGNPRIHWFANGAYIGSCPAGQYKEWTPPPGHILLTACTSQGRCASVRIFVVFE